jgi:hypothetical protein
MKNLDEGASVAAPTVLLRFTLVNLRFKPLWSGTGVSGSNPVANTWRWCEVECCRPPRRWSPATQPLGTQRPVRSSLIIAPRGKQWRNWWRQGDYRYSITNQTCSGSIPEGGMIEAKRDFEARQRRHGSKCKQPITLFKIYNVLGLDTDNILIQVCYTLAGHGDDKCVHNFGWKVWGEETARKT